jgi:hypothetical protein
MHWEKWAEFYGKLSTPHKKGKDCPVCTPSECYVDDCDGLMHRRGIMMYPESRDMGTMYKCEKCGKEMSA